MPKACTHDGCGKPAWARGFCPGHYSAWRYKTKLARPRPKLSCKVEGCPNPYQGKGFCNSHYQKWLRAERAKKRMEAGLGRISKPCSVSGCPRGASRDHEICAVHRQHAAHKKSRAELPRCSKQPCKYSAFANGLCSYHAKSPDDWRWLAPNGYVYARKPGHPNAADNGLILEHRLVMAEHIGRPLEEDENVHHKNGQRADNAIGNLELWSSAQPKGQRIEDKLQWCRDFLTKYEGFKQP